MKYFDSSHPLGESQVPGVIDLDAGEFEILFQIAHQLANYDELRLTELGCPPPDLESLLEALGAIRRRVNDASRVRVSVSEPQFRKGAADSPRPIVAEVRDAGTVAFRSELPAMAARFPQLMQFVIASIGSREAFLRTGFHSEELEALIAKFEGHLGR